MKSYLDKYRVKLTHIPTGEAITISETRSHHKNKIIGLHALKSRINAINKGIIRNNDLVRCYELPDELDWSKDLKDYEVQK